MDIDGDQFDLSSFSTLRWEWVNGWSKSTSVVA